MKRQFYWFAVVLLLSAMLRPGEAYSNNLIITNVTYTLGGTSTVTFDLSWDNGWCNKVSNNHNWDAAWVFVKFRDCSSPSPSYTHGLISTSLSNHTFNGTGGGGSTTYEPAKSDGTVGIDASPDNTGIMLRNAADPVSGTFNARVTLKVTNLPASGTIDIRVFGIEMVFVAQGRYSLGDATNFNTGSGSYFFSQYLNVVNGNPYSLYGPYPYNPILIASENAQSIYEVNQKYCSQSVPYPGQGGNCPLSAAFPKGYKSFYMMKYEISQGQYADFLNASSPITGIAHYPNHFNEYRHTINYNSPDYVANRPDRACNWLSWSDVTAYLDWAALRPLTEMEYEKACRGPNSPIPFYEMAWGGNYWNTSFWANSISGTEDGTETLNLGFNYFNSIQRTANINANNQSFGNFSNGDGSQGPLRCGIFATSATSTRLETGMGYYGAMELSGNVNEYYVSVRSGDTFYNYPSVNGLSYGDGYVDGSGNQDVANWPPPQPSPLQQIIIRGGGFNRDPSQCSVSYRDIDPDGSTSWSANNNYNRHLASGGRGGR